METISFKREIHETLDHAIERTTSALQKEGFGVLTRIDFHSKIKEKLGKDIPATVILGACNPKLAYEAFCVTTDVTALLPCNAVVRELGAGRVSVELARPAALMRILGDERLVDAARDADDRLKRALENL